LCAIDRYSSAFGFATRRAFGFSAASFAAEGFAAGFAAVAFLAAGFATFAAALGAAFGAIQLAPQIVPGLVPEFDTRPSTAKYNDLLKKQKELTPDSEEAKANHKQLLETLELKKRAADLQIVDVRSPREWKNGHVPGARHIFLPELRQEIGKLDRANPPVQAYSPDGKSIQDNGVTPNVLQAEAELAAADGAADDNLPDAVPDDTPDKKPATDELMKRALTLPEK
jgi:rhodanese-related sulfurtransferase